MSKNARRRRKNRDKPFQLEREALIEKAAKYLPRIKAQLYAREKDGGRLK